MRRCAVLECIQEKAKAHARFFFGHAESMENLALDILPMNSDRARSQLCPIQHDIVRKRAHRSGIGLEFVHIALMRRGERMMCGGPALAIFVVLEHRKICYPEKTE